MSFINYALHEFMSIINSYVTEILISNWNLRHNSICMQKKQHLSWDLEYQKQFFLGVPRNSCYRVIPGKYI